ncbi:DDE_3 domain-containing protein [Trichonephila clavipes]|nr:DDE_3 domain-containing protein [Trichonephila clavipes]
MNIEYIWDVLQRAVQKKSPLPLTPIDLWRALKDSLCQIPPALLQGLIESMPRCVAALLRTSFDNNDDVVSMMGPNQIVPWPQRTVLAICAILST